MLASRKGFSLWIRTLSQINSSEGEVLADRMRKSFTEGEWPVLERWAKMLEGEGLEQYVPVKRETPKWSEARVCKWWAVIRTDSASQHWHLKAVNAEGVCLP